MIGGKSGDIAATDSSEYFVLWINSRCELVHTNIFTELEQILESNLYIQNVFAELKIKRCTNQFGNKLRTHVQKIYVSNFISDIKLRQMNVKIIEF